MKLHKSLHYSLNNYIIIIIWCTLKLLNYLGQRPARQSKVLQARAASTAYTSTRPRRTWTPAWRAAIRAGSRGCASPFPGPSGVRPSSRRWPSAAGWILRGSRCARASLAVSRVSPACSLRAADLQRTPQYRPYRSPKRFAAAVVVVINHHHCKVM